MFLMRCLIPLFLSVWLKILPTHFYRDISDIGCKLNVNRCVKMEFILNNRMYYIDAFPRFSGWSYFLCYFRL